MQSQTLKTWFPMGLNPNGWCKMNVDGLVKDRKIVVVEVVRSNERRWIIGFTKFIGHETTDLA